jgi:hypothetical protein
MACSQSPPAQTTGQMGTDGAALSDLITSLEVEVGANEVRFVLHVTNPTNQPIRLEFPSAQRYDFTVQTAAGESVWTWSADQMFAQVLGEATIPAGGSQDYTASWLPSGRTGVFQAIGRVTASNRKIEQRTTFEIRKP